MAHSVTAGANCFVWFDLIHFLGNSLLNIQVFPFRQGLASVAIPSATIYSIVKLSKFAINRFPKIPSFVSFWAPTMIGLASIPLIIKPIDHIVDFVMDKHFNPFWKESVMPSLLGSKSSSSSSSVSVSSIPVPPAKPSDKKKD
jgi:hypothetical protein